MSINYLDGVRTRALAAIMDPTHEDSLMGVFEWYSKEFHTPLHIVQNELPLDDVLSAYFRSVYKVMPPEERHNLAIWLLETPEERAARFSEDKKNDDDFIRQAQAANSKKVTPAEAAFARMKKARTPNFEGSEDALKVLPLPARKLATKTMPETKLPESLPDPEEVTITYMSAEDFERDLDKPIAPPPRAKPKK